PQPFAQYAPPVVTKPDGVLHDWEFFWGLASRLRTPLTLKFWSYGASYKDLPGGLTLDLDVKPSGEDLIAHLCSYGPVSFDDLKASPAGVRPQLPATTVQAGKDNGGRLQLCPPDVAAELASVLGETVDDPRFKYRLIVRRILEALNSAFLD